MGVSCGTQALHCPHELWGNNKGIHSLTQKSYNNICEEYIYLYDNFQKQ